MHDFVIQGREVLLTEVLLSTRHRTIGGAHYDNALSVQRYRVDEEFGEVLAWVRQNAPQAAVLFTRHGERTVEAGVTAQLMLALHAPSMGAT